jgi:hypothetical protein
MLNAIALAVLGGLLVITGALAASVGVATIVFLLCTILASIVVISLASVIPAALLLTFFRLLE